MVLEDAVADDDATAPDVSDVGSPVPPAGLGVTYVNYLKQCNKGGYQMNKANCGNITLNPKYDLRNETFTC